MGLKLQGELITKRCVIIKEANFEAILDKNEYLDYTDYELEIEYTQEHENNAQAIMKMFRDILTRRKCFLVYKEILAKTHDVPSKSSRFFERMSSTKTILQAPVSDALGNYNTRVDYSDPDDYLQNYFTPIIPNKRVCPSCENFDGSYCHSPSGSCYFLRALLKNFFNYDTNCRG